MNGELVAPGEACCFVFVCQAGALEAKGVLLAASLRHHLAPEHDLVAAVPTPASHWGSLAPATVRALERLSVRIVPIVNRVSSHYPIGNKLDCLAVATDCRRIMFLDTDMLLLRSVDLSVLANSRLAAVPASRAHASRDQWASFYRDFGLPCPPFAMRTLISDEPSLPYFNSGFVSAEAAIARELSDQWVNCARRLLLRTDLPLLIRDRFLDQIALPIAAARLRAVIQPLPLTWNFPSWSMKIGQGPLPAFFHYQELPRLQREAITSNVLSALMNTHSEVIDVLQRALAGIVGDLGVSRNGAAPSAKPNNIFH